MPFGFSDDFIVEAPAPAWRNDRALKLQFGIQLAKNPQQPFEAACELFGKDTNKALWVVNNWMNDPIVLGSKEAFVVTREQETKLLDKNQLACKLLDFAEEKTLDELFYLHESKDRLAAFKLYAEVQGYIGNKIDIDASTKFNNNFMTIKFVKPEQEIKETSKTVDINPQEVIQPQEVKSLPVRLKLVSNSKNIERKII